MDPLSSLYPCKTLILFCAVINTCLFISCNWILPFNSPSSDVAQTNTVLDAQIPDENISTSDANFFPKDTTPPQTDLDSAKRDQPIPDKSSIPVDYSLSDAAIPFDYSLSDSMSLDYSFADLPFADSMVSGPCELTENNASQWQGGCNIEGCDPSSTCTNSVSFTDETNPSKVKVGQSSILFKCPDCGVDNFAGLTTSKPWDLSQQTKFRFYIWTESVSSTGWQNDECGTNPWIILQDTAGRKQRIEGKKNNPPYNLNDSLNQWLEIEGPLQNAVNHWEISKENNFNIAKIKTIEIHLDPWDWGFTVLLDGLTFFDQNGKQFTQCNPS